MKEMTNFSILRYEFIAEKLGEKFGNSDDLGFISIWRDSEKWLRS